MIEGKNVLLQANAVSPGNTILQENTNLLWANPKFLRRTQKFCVPEKLCLCSQKFCIRLKYCKLNLWGKFYFCSHLIFFPSLCPPRESMKHFGLEKYIHFKTCNAFVTENAGKLLYLHLRWMFRWWSKLLVDIWCCWLLVCVSQQSNYIIFSF